MTFRINDAWRMLTLVIIASISCGCSEPRAAPVDVSIARETLIEVLEHWKNGETPESLRSRSPEIVVQESLWSDGRQLRDFQLNGEGRVEDANWFCEVELTLESSNGRDPETRTITFVVGTDPVLTVFHAIL
ncbi:MAG: hypothetical protein KDA85_15405 [Planctomycetaceae bacterium]|nr:hypothetical protein [Planctomycetaceae bacterium]